MSRDAIDDTAGPDAPPRFQGRGMLLDGALYIERPADVELVEALSRGEHCHVLAPRQVGKSNLRVRATEALRAKGVRCASIDLTGIGSRVSADAWYFGLVRIVAARLGLSVDLEAFWEKSARLALPQRWIEFLRVEVLSSAQTPLVLFLDEIDMTLGLDFGAEGGERSRFGRDDFFRSILFMQNARADDPAWELLTFCLLGVAAPTDLVEELRLTPFNKSRPIHLEDFARGALEKAKPGLLDAGGDPGALLDAVFAWTGGHPAFTQQICERLVLEGAGGAGEADRVRATVESLYLRRGRSDDPILGDVDNRFTVKADATRDAPAMIGLYRRLLREGRIAQDVGDRLALKLRIAGLVTQRTDEAGAWLEPRNRIFATVFDDAWASEQLRARAFADPLTRWVDGGKRDEDLLRGDQLDEAVAWTAGRSDITQQEIEFVLASQKAAQEQERDAQKKALEDVEIRVKLARVSSQRRWLAIAIAVAVLFSVGLAVLEAQRRAALQRKFETEQRLSMAEAEERRRNLELVSARSEAKQTEAELNAKLMGKEAEVALLAAAAAQKKLEEANQSLAEANKRAGQSQFAAALARQRKQEADDLADKYKQAENQAAQTASLAKSAKTAAENERNDAVRRVQQASAMAAIASARATSLREQLDAKEAEASKCAAQLAQIGNLKQAAENDLQACTTAREKCQSALAPLQTSNLDACLLAKTACERDLAQRDAELARCNAARGRGDGGAN